MYSLDSILFVIVKSWSLSYSYHCSLCPVHVIADYVFWCYTFMNEWSDNDDDVDDDEYFMLDENR